MTALHTLFIGDDPAAREVLLHLPGDVARAETVAQARDYLLAPAPADRRYLLVYGDDVATVYGTPGHAQAAPLGPSWGPRIVLTAADVIGPAVWAGAVALGVDGVFQLPAALPSLLLLAAGGQVFAGQR